MTDLRAKASALFSVGCRAADPAKALERALAEHPLPHPDPGGALLVVAIGKAAIPMARSLLAQVQGQPCTALVVTNPENAGPVPGATVFAAGHPVPDETGGQAALAV